ncbi:3264_t:CDS:2 [Dentiscutata heterogama]|uniref:3264_t:CDS:1 n=1 Tax=Dentiscutata heterogama TaxID=1316150 RepID=A0ACA9N3H3_9GLOM|nr:3264_t:CDS:2 [Dentiscutata heterogama]
MEDSDDSILEVAEHSDLNTQTSKTQKKRDCPKNILWDNHFKEINLHKDGHKGWECLYCKEQNLRVSDINMNTHLVLNCKKVLPNIRQELLQKFPIPKVLAKILLPAKNAIKIIESKSTTTANVFLFLVQMAATINTLKKNNLLEHGGIESANTLVAQIKKYDVYEPHIILLLWKKLNHHKPVGLLKNEEAEKVSNIAKLHTYYLTNTQNELNYVALEVEFEQIMEDYSNLVEYNDDMFTSEEFDEDYISNEDNLDEIRQFDCENLEISEIINFNAFLEEQVSEVNINSNIETEEEAADYDINEVINAAISNMK